MTDITCQMDPNCECQQKNVDYSEYDELCKIKPPPQIKTIKVDFGKVAACGKYVKPVELEDLNNEEVLNYKIERKSVVNPIYQVFNLNRYEGSMKPGERLKLKVKYTPQIPYQRNQDTFVLTEESSVLLKIIATGETKGPLLRTSVKHMKFIKTPGSATCKRIIELKNISDVPAEFIFDLDEETAVFTVDTMKGTIPGLSHIYVEINFVPKEYGFFSQKLSCLTWCDAPLVTHLFGVYVQNDPDIKTSHFNSYPFPFEETVGYEAYFQDAASARRILPVFINKAYIDFGRTMKESEPNSNIQTISLANLANEPICVRWPKDDIFSVTPRYAEILYNDQWSFTFSFNPKETNAFYSKMMIAQIDWKSYRASFEDDTRKSYNIPLTATTRLQGHSFPEGEYWISNVVLDPQIVVLPPCLPGHSSNTNFKICAIGHLPVMYRIVSPKKTNIVMKPLVGVIHSYSVVTVNLYTQKNQEKAVFDEQWYLILNGRQDKRIPLCVKGEIGVPQVVIGHEDNIRFESVCPGCDAFLVAPLKNISSFEIRFEFDTTGYDCIQLNPINGFLTSDEETVINCKYTGNRCIPNKITLKCRLQNVQKIEELVGVVYNHLFFVHTKCVHSQLCATPNQGNFGKLRWGTFAESVFHLFNFGESIIYFQLNVVYHSHNNKIKIKPRSGEVQPGGKIKVTLSIHVLTVGNHRIEILYGVKKNNDSKELIDDNLIHVYDAQYSCSFPRLQVEEIVEHDFGPLFAKTHFWQYLEIIKFNAILRIIKDGETRKIYMNMPNFEIGPNEYYVTLLVKNISIFDMEVRLKRKQMCQCQLKEIPGHINVRKKVFDCPHREMLNMEFSSTKFFKKAEQLLTIRVKYCVPEQTKMAYILDLGDNRFIELIFTLFTVPEDEYYISLYETKSEMTLRPISVCRRVAPIQTIWLYNNTNMPVPYKFDETEFEAICRKDGFDIFKCLNPTGEVQAYKALPLLIKFHPLEIKKYEISVKLRLGDRMVDFSISGFGQIRVSGEPFIYRMPASSRKTYEFPVTLSIDYLIINCLPVWSTTERVIFMKNVSKDKLVQYTWEEAVIDGVLELTAASPSGMLKPKEARPVLIRIKSFNEACSTEILLTCRMLDYVQFALHKKTLELYNIRQAQVEAEFTVTDEGSYHEPNEIVVADLPKLLTISLPVNVNVVHSKDRDTYITLKQQFKTSPQEDVSINMLSILKSCFPLALQSEDVENEELKSANDKDKDRIKTILEELISDFAFGNSLNEVFKMSESQASPFYSQLSMGKYGFVKDRGIASNDELLRLRKKAVRELFRRPKTTTVRMTLNELIKSTIMELFKLGLQNPSEQEVDEEVDRILKLCTTLLPDSAPCIMD